MAETWWIKQSQLDSDQKKVFTLPLGEDHLIKGPPGSGKTNLLLLRAKQLIGSKVPNVVILVHTRALQEFIRAGAAQYGIPPDKIQTSRKFSTDLLYRRGASIALPKDFDVSRSMLVEALQAQIKSGYLKREFSCLLLDEAQDFLPSEISVFQAISEHLFAVADLRQKVYKGQDAIASLEQNINAVKLTSHYRNGRKICMVADGLAKHPGTEPSLLNTSKYPEDKAESSVDVLGPCPLSKQCDALLASLDTQMKAYPDEMIGVACPRGEDLATVIERLRESPYAELLVTQTSDDGYEPFDPGKRICVCKLHSAKGLEFRAFHILAAEGLKKFPLQRELTFTGVTRAKTSLRLYYSDGLPGYLEEALTTLEPPGKVLQVSELLEADDDD